MITIRNGGPVITSNEVSGELLLSPGERTISHSQWLRPSTNAPFIPPALRDGAIILVDESGRWEIIDGPTYVPMVASGFTAAVMAVGLALMLRYFVRFAGKAVTGGVE